jgi:hypothetical protein
MILKPNSVKVTFSKVNLRSWDIVAAAAMQPDPSKVAGVSDWPVPKNVYEVRFFLGMANYCRKCIRAYVAMTAPLTDFLKGLHKQKKKGKLANVRKLFPAAREQLHQQFASQWTSACQNSFDALKMALTTAPVLVLPNFEKSLEVVTDACQVPPAIGGVLLQEGQPVACYSHTLSGAELNYSVTDLEMLGVIGALRKWRCYLEGRRFTIVTDHKPNTYLDSASNIHTLKRRARWLEESSGYYK